jgi:hypothetical protein
MASGPKLSSVGGGPYMLLLPTGLAQGPSGSTSIDTLKRVTLLKAKVMMEVIGYMISTAVCSRLLATFLDYWRVGVLRLWPRLMSILGGRGRYPSQHLELRMESSTKPQPLQWILLLRHVQRAMGSNGAPTIL